jgi:hypothetical protein
MRLNDDCPKEFNELNENLLLFVFFFVEIKSLKNNNQSISELQIIFPHKSREKTLIQMGECSFDLT